jgi:hypothetical protein
VAAVTAHRNLPSAAVPSATARHGEIPSGALSVVTAGRTRAGIVSAFTARFVRRRSSLTARGLLATARAAAGREPAAPGAVAVRCAAVPPAIDTRIVRRAALSGVTFNLNASSRSSRATARRAVIVVGNVENRVAPDEQQRGSELRVES